MNEIIMLISAALGTLGFSILFKVTPRHLPAASIGGLISCGIFIIFDMLGANLFVSNFFAMAVVGILSEIFARIFRAPAAVFLVPSTIPLVPGGSLYYTMSSLIFPNTSAFAFYGKSTLMTGLGIAAGMISASVICAIATHIIPKKTTNKL